MPHFVMFRSINTRDPECYAGTHELTFSDLAESFEDPEIVQTKDLAPLLCFVRSTKPEIRQARYVTHATIAAFDVDGVDPKAFDTLLADLRSRDLAYAWHTTFSHMDLTKNPGEPPGRYRLFLPISEDIPAVHWKHARAAMVQEVFGTGPVQPDRQANDIARLLYIPSVPHERRDHYAWDRFEGKPLNTQALIGIGRTLPVSVTGGRTLTLVPQDITSLSQLYKRRRGFSGATHESLKALARGNPYADPGRRETATRDLTWQIAREYPQATTESVCAVFEPSLQLMEHDHPDGCPTLEDVAYRFESALEKIDYDKRQQLRGIDEELEEKLLRIMYGFPRGPASKEEIEADAKSLGLTINDYLTSGLVLRTNKQIFCRDIARGMYREASDQTAKGVIAQYLVAIESVDLMHTSDKGLRPKPLDQLVSDYGRSMTGGVVYDLTIPDTRVDFQEGRIRVSPCPLMFKEPIYDAWTDDWLERLGGDQYERLIDWLAMYTKLDQPLPALYIEGAPNTGKSLFGSALASLYGDGLFVEADTIFGNESFNADLNRNPLVVADEVFPRTFRGEPDTEALRKFVQDRKKTYKRKYMGNTAIYGCHRVLITANHPNALTQHGASGLSKADFEAIGDRLIHICTGDDVSAWMRDQVVPPEYVTGGVFARHLLWLRENHKPPMRGRFWVPGSCDGLLHRMATTGSVAEGVCEILLQCLDGAENMTKTQGAVAIHEGDLVVVARKLSHCWRAFFGTENPPKPNTLNNALNSLITDRKQIMVKGQRKRVGVIDIDRLADYAENVGHGADVVLERFDQLTSKKEVNK